MKIDAGTLMQSLTQSASKKDAVKKSETEKTDAAAKKSEAEKTEATVKKSETEKTGATVKKSETEKTKSAVKASASKKTGTYGKSVGDVRLSDTAAKYYEELKKKYKNVDFVLVSEDEKANAQANAAKYANPTKMVVLIDVDKVERMAADENYRKQYESIIQNAGVGFEQIKSQTESAGLGDLVKGYGMSVNEDGSTSFFAVLKKSSEAQKQRIADKAAANKAAKKAAEKKAEKKEAKEKLEEARLSKKEAAAKADKASGAGKKETLEESDYDNTVTVTAASIEELMRKISDYGMEYRSNNILTEAETYIGGNIDFRG